MNDVRNITFYFRGISNKNPECFIATLAAIMVAANTLDVERLKNIADTVGYINNSRIPLLYLTDPHLTDEERDSWRSLHRQGKRLGLIPGGGYWKDDLRLAVQKLKGLQGDCSFQDILDRLFCGVKEPEIEGD